MGESTEIYYVQKRDFETEAWSGSTIGRGLFVSYHPLMFLQKEAMSMTMRALTWSSPIVYFKPS